MPTRLSGQDPYAAVVRLLPEELAHKLLRLDPQITSEVEEVRLRTLRPVMLITGQADFFLGRDGGVSDTIDGAYVLSADTMNRVVGGLSNWSVYALEEEMRQGFLTLVGGHRVGLAGRAVVEAGHVRTLKDIASLNLRISRAFEGVGEQLLPYLLQDGRWLPTLIVSPPQCGKTTLIRDLVRLASWGVPDRGLPGRKVGIADERSEIAGCYRGVPQRDVGPRTDVLDGVPKAEGMMMLIRSLSPELLVTDEIGRRADTEAMLEATRSGVCVLTTAHGESFEEVAARPDMAPLFKQRVFGRWVLLSRAQGPGTVLRVVDGANGKVLSDRPFRLRQGA